MSEDDRRSFREMLAPPLREAVKEATRIDDPAELELLAGSLLPSFALVGIPGAAAVAVDAVAEIPGALTLLRGMAAAAPPPLSVLAADAAGELGPGPVSVAAERVGTLVPEKAWDLDVGEAVSSVMVSCSRPGSAVRQVLCLTLEWPATGGAIKDGFASAPVAAGDVEEAFLGPARTHGIEPTEISTTEAIDRIAKAAARCADVGLGPTREALFATTLLLRAARLAGADELLEPLAGLPSLAEGLDAFEEDELDEEALQADVDEHLQALERWAEGQAFGGDLGELVVYAGRCMADFRAYHCDGLLEGWNAADLETFLFDFVPRKVGLEEGDVERFPGAVAEVLRFLEETGRLSPPLADELMLLALEAEEEFVESATDPSNWGLAKGMVAAMTAAGVDPADDVAVQAWIDVFNARPREEREQLVPAIGRPPLPLARPLHRSGGKRNATKARKAKRQARKRNRR